MCRKTIYLILSLVWSALILSRPARADLVGWWTFDETEGTVAADSSGSGNDGTLTNGGVWTTGYVGGALQLDGNNDYVQLAIGQLIPTLQECTIALWVNWSGQGGSWQRILDFGTGTANYIYLCPSTGNTNAMRVAIVANNGIWNEFDSSQGALPIGEWHHVTVTASESEAVLAMYLDGEQVGSQSDITNSLNDLGVTTQNWIGRSQYADPYLNGTVDDLRIYNEVLSQGAIQRIVAGLMSVSSKPNPADGATDVRPDVVLSWQPGEYAATHDIYFGTSFDDVNDAGRANPLGVLVSQGQAAATYDPEGLLELGQTYYWRVDEVNAVPDTMIFRGTVWSFTAEPYTYPVANVTATATIPSEAGSQIDNVVNGSGLLAGGGHAIDVGSVWKGVGNPGDPVTVQFEFDRVYKLDGVKVWNYNHQYEPYLGFSLKDITVEHSTDGAEWTTLGDYTLPQGAGKTTFQALPIDFGGAAAKYVRFVVNSNYGGKGFGLSEVQFNYIPTYAREPQPAAGAVDVGPGVVLSWRPGREAASHEVHLGTDAEAVAAAAALAGTVNGPSFDTSGVDLLLGEKYYWMVNEVNEAATPSAWAGDVWDFNTPDSLVVEDFESYTDDEGTRIYESWPDGYGVPANGSIVGNDSPPYAEQENVHGGAQAMPFTYGDGGATTSEATLTLPAAQDWTRAGAQTLVVWLRGSLGNTAAQLYLKVNGTRVDYSGSAGSLAGQVWKQWNIDLAALGAAARSAKTLTIGVAGSGTGTLYFDDIRLYREAGPATGPAADPGTVNLVAYYPMSDSVNDTSGNNRNGAAQVGSSFGPGPQGYGRALVLDGVSGYVTLPIGSLIQSLNSATFATWVNWSGAGGAWQRVFDFGTGETVNMFLTPSAGATVRFAITAGGNTAESILDAPGVLPTGWHHLAVTIDATSGQMDLYLDGGVIDSGTTETLPSALGNTTQNWIGRSQYTADPYLDASVDEFRIYNRALSEAEVRYLVGDR